jgi:hypothetical protein
MRAYPYSMQVEILRMVQSFMKGPAGQMSVFPSTPRRRLLCDPESLCPLTLSHSGSESEENLITWARNAMRVFIYERNCALRSGWAIQRVEIHPKAGFRPTPLSQ